MQKISVFCVSQRMVSAEKPEAQAGSVIPNLEDAYLYFIGSHNDGHQQFQFIHYSR
ncbi:MAG: hypothetical protein IPN96_10310 [Anaerolineales bacterium]|nr:hypothetical protein [Anaerolineales bacterium]